MKLKNFINLSKTESSLKNGIKFMPELSIRRISYDTGICVDDLTSTMEQLNLFMYDKFKNKFSIDLKSKLIEQHQERLNKIPLAKRELLKMNRECLIWSPYISCHLLLAANATSDQVEYAEAECQVDLNDNNDEKQQENKQENKEEQSADEFFDAVENIEKPKEIVKNEKKKTNSIKKKSKKFIEENKDDEDEEEKKDLLDENKIEKLSDLTITASPSIPINNKNNTQSTPLVSSKTVPSSISYDNLFKSKLEEIPETNTTKAIDKNKNKILNLQCTPKSNQKRTSKLANKLEASPLVAQSTTTSSSSSSMKQTRLDSFLFTKNVKEKTNEITENITTSITTTTQETVLEQQADIKNNGVPEKMVEFVQPVTPPPPPPSSNTCQKLVADVSLPLETSAISISSTKAELSQTSMNNDLMNDTNFSTVSAQYNESETQDFNVSEMDVSVAKKQNDDEEKIDDTQIENEKPQITEETDSSSSVSSTAVVETESSNKVVEIVQDIKNIENVVIKQVNNNNNTKEKTNDIPLPKNTEVPSIVTVPPTSSTSSNTESEFRTPVKLSSQAQIDNSTNSCSKIKTSVLEDNKKQQHQIETTSPIPSLVPPVSTHHDSFYQFNQNQQQHQYSNSYYQTSNNYPVNNGNYNSYYAGQQLGPNQPIYAPVTSQPINYNNISQQQAFSYQHQNYQPYNAGYQQPVIPATTTQTPSLYSNNGYQTQPNYSNQYGNTQLTYQHQYANNYTNYPSYQQQQFNNNQYNSYNNNNYNNQIPASNTYYNNQYQQQQFYQKSPPPPIPNRPSSVLSTAIETSTISTTTTLHQLQTIPPPQLPLATPTYATLTPLQGTSPPSNAPIYNTANVFSNSQTKQVSAYQQGIQQQQQHIPNNSQFPYNSTQSQQQQQFFNNGSYNY